MSCQFHSDFKGTTYVSFLHNFSITLVVRITKEELVLALYSDFVSGQGKSNVEWYLSRLIGAVR